MDRGLKERLVGAAVLVALGVWLIPWVLDGSEQTTSSEPETLTLPVPAEATQLRSQTISLDSERESPTPAFSTSESAVHETESEVTSAPASPRPPEGAAAGWFVQTGSYADVENAQRQAERVSSYGFEARVSTYIAGGRSMQRVRIGPQASRDSAEAVASALSAHGFVVQVFIEE